MSLCSFGASGLSKYLACNFIAYPMMVWLWVRLGDSLWPRFEILPSGEKLSAL